MDRPRLPCSSPPYQRSSCTVNGSSRPRSFRICSNCAGVALIPPMIDEGSPGMRRIIPKVMRLTISSTGTAPNTRRRMRPASAYFLISGSFREPHVGHTRYPEGLVSLHVRPHALHLGQRTEWDGIDVVEDELLHARECRLTVLRVREVVHIVPRLDEIRIVLAIGGLVVGIWRREELHRRQRAKRRLCAVSGKEEIPAWLVLGHDAN